MYRYFLALVLVVASGCQLIPDPPPERSPTAPPAAWLSDGNTGSVPSIRQWLDDLGDPELTTLVERGLAGNHNLRASRARLRAIEAVVRSRHADQLPRLDLDASISQRDNGRGNAVSNVAIGPAASWELDLWRRLERAELAAVADASAAAEDEVALRLSLAVTITANWTQAVTNQLLLDFATATTASYQRTLDVSNSRFRSGVGSALDVHLAEANVAAGQASQYAARNNLKTGIRNLERLVGDYPAGALDFKRALPTIELIPAGLPAALLERRPDVRAAATRLQAAELRREIADRLRLPTVRLTGSAGTSSEKLGELLDGDSLLWSLAAGLAQPLFDGGRIDAEQERTRALQEAAAADWAQTVLDAFTEVEISLTAEAFLRDQLASLESAATAAEAAEAQAQSRYREGISSLTDVLVAQRRAIDARRNVIVVRNSLLQNRLNLYLALGGSFQQ